MIFVSMATVLVASQQLSATPSETQNSPTIQQEAAKLQEKLEASGWHGQLILDGANTRCRTQVSSGDAQLDEVACNAMWTCTARAVPQMKAVSDPTITDDRREELNEVLNLEISKCVVERRRELFTELAGTRMGDLEKDSNAQD